MSRRRPRAQVNSLTSLTSAASDDLQRNLAVELNALYTIEQLLKSPVISKAVKDGSLELHAAVLDCTTGKVTFLELNRMRGVSHPLLDPPRVALSTGRRWLACGYS